MKSILLFIPDTFHNQSPGCMYGIVVHDGNNQCTKFFVLGVSETVQTINKYNNELVPLGYFHGNEKKREYWEKKYPNWIELYLSPQSNLPYDYKLRNIMLKNQKISLTDCHTVITLYNRDSLLKAELYGDKYPGDHFSELRAILTKERWRKNFHKMKKSWFSQFKAYFFNTIMSTSLCFISWFCKATEVFNPVLKYSSLGLHLTTWFRNAEWILSSLLQKKRFTLKTTNYTIAMAVDMLLGFLSIKLLLFLTQDTWSEIVLLYAEKLVEYLKDLINWLMGSPAGLKLNRPFNNVLGKFFLYHIHLWWAFLIALKPVMDIGFGILLFFGRLGITFQISIVADLLTLASFHTYCIYVYAARLFNLQTRGLTALFRLFLGKKKNPLRERVDSCEYQPDQLFVGTLLFTVLLFLMPTTWVYYFVFTTLRVIMIGLGGLSTRLTLYLQIFPIYVYFKWLFSTVEATGSIGIQLLDRNGNGPIILKTKAIIAPWSETWKRSIPDTVSLHPPMEWGKIVNNLFWGQLLYPL